MSINIRGLALVLATVFIILKLTEVISWSWLWVLSPVWIYVALFLLLFIIVFIGVVFLGYKL